MVHTGTEAKKHDKELKPTIDEHHSQPIIYKNICLLVFLSLKEQTSKGEGETILQPALGSPFPDNYLNKAASSRCFLAAAQTF